MTFWIDTANHIRIPTKTREEIDQLFYTVTADKDILRLTSGLRTAQLARMLLGAVNQPDFDADSEDIDDRPIVVVAGLDQIGAIGLYAAQHLEKWGAWVQVVLTQQPDFSPDVMFEVTKALDVLKDLGVSTSWAEDGWELPPGDLLIDAMQTQSNRDLIQLANSHRAPVLSIGSPAGIDPDSGESSSHYIMANATLALGFPLGALASESGRPHCGDLYLADIGLEDKLYVQSGGHKEADKSTLFDGKKIIALETIFKTTANH